MPNTSIGYRPPTIGEIFFYYLVFFVPIVYGISLLIKVAISQVFKKIHKTKVNLISSCIVSILLVGLFIVPITRSFKTTSDITNIFLVLFSIFVLFLLLEFTDKVLRLQIKNKAITILVIVLALVFIFPKKTFKHKYNSVTRTTKITDCHCLGFTVNRAETYCLGVPILCSSYTSELPFPDGFGL